MGQDEHALVAQRDLFRLSALVLSVTSAAVALLSIAGSPTWLLTLLSGATASLAVVRGIPPLLPVDPPQPCRFPTHRRDRPAGLLPHP
ncbi:hypothetical protein [endosymbiont of unidentified scaly snail isolate Monju]|uniref:hypothetical protein n=1 Tax=endosymbiont of unidentified scaly snail isolate Monju TaxID=1248727 RepID=UPI0011DDB3D5|nr:hypothetical protein [endosymbiont of unidentified scaly snail isolate Monju]